MIDIGWLECMTLFIYFATVATEVFYSKLSIVFKYEALATLLLQAKQEHLFRYAKSTIECKQNIASNIKTDSKRFDVWFSIYSAFYITLVNLFMINKLYIASFLLSAFCIYTLFRLLKHNKRIDYLKVESLQKFGVCIT